MDFEQNSINNIPENSRNLLLRMTGIEVLNDWEIFLIRKKNINAYTLIAAAGFSFVRIVINLDSGLIVNSAFHFNDDEEQLIGDILKRQKLVAPDFNTENVIYCHKDKADKHPLSDEDVFLNGYNTFGKYDCKMFQRGDIDHFKAVMCDCGTEIFQEIGWIYDDNRLNNYSAKVAWAELGKDWVGQIHKN